MRALLCIPLSAAIVLATAPADLAGQYTVDFGASAGFFRFDDGPWNEYWNEEIGSSPLFGVRAAVENPWGLALEAAYGYAPQRARSLRRATVCITGPCPSPLVQVSERVGTHLYSGSLRYRIPVAVGVRPFVIAGIGGISMFTEDLAGRGAFSGAINDLVVSFGGGLLLPVRDDGALRLQVRDHLQRCRGASGPIGLTDAASACPYRDSWIHNLEYSFGVQFAPRAVRRR